MNDEETWLPVADTEGRYEVSSLGRLRQHYKRGTRMMAGYRRPYGYYIVSINGEQILRHVLIATTFYGPAAPGQVCRHLNGVAGDDRVENLRWGTPKENAQDSKDHGTNYALRKTECKWGHEFTEANTFIDNLGRRICRTCKLRHSRRVDEVVAARRRARRVESWTARLDRRVLACLDSGEFVVSYRNPGLVYYREDLDSGKRIRVPSSELHSLLPKYHRSAA